LSGEKFEEKPEIFFTGKAFEQSIENVLIDLALEMSLVGLVDFINSGGEADH